MGISPLTAARISLVSIILLLYYGSIYPGVLREDGSLSFAWDNLLMSLYLTADARNLVDILLNVLVYIPLGFCFPLAVRWRWLWRIAGAVLLGFSISLSVEIMQGFLEGRYSSFIDIVTNTVGSGLGAVAAGIVVKHVPANLASSARRVEADAVTLAGVWFVAQCFPFIPSIGYYKLARKLEALVAGQVFQYQTLVTVGDWVAIALVLERLAKTFADRFALLALAVLPARLLIHERELSMGEIAGALLGLALWRFLLARRPWKNIAGFAIIIAGILLSELMPFRFSNSATTFHWLPFHASLETRSWEIALMVLAMKAYRYGAAVWIVRQCGPAYSIGGGFVALLLLGCEWAQRYLPGRSPEIADSLIAVMMTALLWQMHRAARH